MEADIISVVEIAESLSITLKDGSVVEILSASSLRAQIAETEDTATLALRGELELAERADAWLEWIEEMKFLEQDSYYEAEFQ